MFEALSKDPQLRAIAILLGLTIATATIIHYGHQIKLAKLKEHQTKMEIQALEKQGLQAKPVNT